MTLEILRLLIKETCQEIAIVFGIQKRGRTNERGFKFEEVEEPLRYFHAFPVNLGLSEV